MKSQQFLNCPNRPTMVIPELVFREDQDSATFAPFGQVVVELSPLVAAKEFSEASIEPIELRGIQSSSLEPQQPAWTRIGGSLREIEDALQPSDITESPEPLQIISEGSGLVLSAISTEILQPIKQAQLSISGSIGTR